MVRTVYGRATSERKQAAMVRLQSTIGKLRGVASTVAIPAAKLAAKGSRGRKKKAISRR